MKQHNRTSEDVLLKKHEEIPLTIKKLGINGEGIGFFKRKAVFVAGALPGEEIVASISVVKPNYTEAVVKKIRKASPERVSPPCPVYDKCGGCQIQHISYKGQLENKRDIVAQAFERYTKKYKVTVKEVKGMKDPWHYRNKSQWQLQKKEGKTAAGLYSLDSHRLVDLTGTGCMVEHTLVERINQKTAAVIKELDLPIYDAKRKKNGLRTIAVRISTAENTAQLTFISSSDDLPNKKKVISRIKQDIPEVVSIFLNVQPSRTSTVFGEKTEHLWGSKIITETLESYSYSLSPQAFFQLNPSQTTVLYNEAKKAAGLTGEERIVDAYCGSGTIGIWMADQAKEGRGMDIEKASINNASENAAAYGFSHLTFYEGAAEKLLPEWKQQGWQPDVVFVDPPRTGCDNVFLDTIAQIKPKKLVYISCNPSTLAKDAGVLLEKGFSIGEVQPVDMFPQTAQVEAVTTFYSSSNE